jgi:hypothetical protein
VLKEGFGHRREVRLRIQLVSREERVMEWLRRWLRRSEERLDRSEKDASGNLVDSREVLSEMIQDAKILIDTLDNPLSLLLKIKTYHPYQAPLLV